MTPISFLPIPRQIEYGRGSFQVESGRNITLAGFSLEQLGFSCAILQKALQANARVDWTVGQGRMGITLAADAALHNSQAYNLKVAEDGIEVSASSAQGIYYGVCTLVQILEQAQRNLPFLRISDAPDFVDRGVMLDVSRDKVPTMETMFDLVDMLTSWKINQLQLYIEHTFAYRDHRTVWENASPFTAAEIQRLDRYCRERFIALVPNQNSFGHMNRWLKHPAYRDLAECPDPPAGSWWGLDPFTLNPLDPRSLDLIRGLYDELLPNFSDSRFNVGCDETFDLGKGRSSSECARRGAGRVYLDFLVKVYHEVKARDHTMMFWGDIVAGYPDLVPELPRDVVALEWGYEADHPFDERAQDYATAKIPFYLCPGTSSWNSIAGRTANAIGNIRSAVENGLLYGAVGLLNTDWGDNGHMQYLPVSYLGFAYGAAMSWCGSSNRDSNLPAVLDKFAFRDAGGITGQVAYDLGNAHRRTDLELHNSTILFHLLHQPIQQARDEVHGLTAESLQHTMEAIDQAVAPLERADLKRRDASLIKEEFESAARWMRHAAVRGLLALDAFENPNEVKRDLLSDLNEQLDTYKRLWHARNRPGGFKDSVARLERMRDDYAD